MAVKNLKMKAVRAGMDLSQEKLAELVGKYNPTLNLCVAIRKALHKTLDELFWEEQQEI